MHFLLNMGIFHFYQFSSGYVLATTASITKIIQCQLLGHPARLVMFFSELRSAPKYPDQIAARRHPVKWWNQCFVTGLWLHLNQFIKWLTNHDDYYIRTGNLWNIPSRSNYHPEFQVPKMEVLNLLRLFWGWVFPYISRIHTAYIGGTYLHFRYLKSLVKLDN